MSIRPSEEEREQIRAAFIDNPGKGYRPPELVEEVGLKANTVAMAVWDLIDSGELFINREKKIRMTPSEVVNAAISV